MKMCFVPSALTNSKEARFDNEFSKLLDNEDARCDEDHHQPVILGDWIRSQERTDLNTENRNGHVGQLDEEEKESGWKSAMHN